MFQTQLLIFLKNTTLGISFFHKFCYSLKNVIKLHRHCLKRLIRTSISPITYLRIFEDPSVTCNYGLHVRHTNVLVQQDVVEQQDLSGQITPVIKSGTSPYNRRARTTRFHFGQSQPVRCFIEWGTGEERLDFVLRDWLIDLVKEKQIIQNISCVFLKICKA